MIILKTIDSIFFYYEQCDWEKILNKNVGFYNLCHLFDLN